jgi:SAM-dependent methyltransferase
LAASTIVLGINCPDDGLNACQDRRMASNRSKFAGGNQDYLRDEQYRNAERLTIRATLHTNYGTATMRWFDWVHSQLALRPGDQVLEVGCGPGWLWAEAGWPIPDGVALTLSDLSTGMVIAAIERVRRTGGLRSVEGRAADLGDLPFAARSFHRVIANHMLYHLPDPTVGVKELARMVRPDGTVIVATNGRRHTAELRRLRAEVFGGSIGDDTLDAFGADVAFPILRDHFGRVEWRTFNDELRCTDPADVVAYICSTPPGEDASDEELMRLTNAVQREFERGGGEMKVSKDVGVFVCAEPVELTPGA